MRRSGATDLSDLQQVTIKCRDCDYEGPVEEFKWRESYICPNCGHISGPSSYPGYPWYDRLHFATDVEKQIWALIKEHKPELLPEICKLKSHRWVQDKAKTRDHCNCCLETRVKEQYRQKGSVNS